MGLLFDLENIEALRDVFDLLLVFGGGTILFSFFLKAMFGGYLAVSRMFFGLTSSMTAVSLFGRTFLLPNFAWFFLVSVFGSLSTRAVIFAVKKSSLSLFSGSSDVLDGQEYLDRHDID